MVFETSFDDGTWQDVRLAILLAKYGMPAVFYIPIDRSLDWGAVKGIAEHFEIGSHTVSHPPDLKRISHEEKKFEIQESKKMLESALGKRVDKFCYPRGRYDDESVELVKEAGYTEARTTLVLHTSVEDVFRKHTTIHVHPNRPEYNNRPWLALAKEYLTKAKEEDAYFHIWGHSAEIDKYGLWRELEEFLIYARPLVK